MGKCKDCDWWELIEDDAVLAQNNAKERGRCHRRPPIATANFLPAVNQITREVVPQSIETTVWPITLPDMWCGEFKPAKVPKSLSEPAEVAS